MIKCISAPEERLRRVPVPESEDGARLGTLAMVEVHWDNDVPVLNNNANHISPQGFSFKVRTNSLPCIRGPCIVLMKVHGVLLLPTAPPTSESPACINASQLSALLAEEPRWSGGSAQRCEEGDCDTYDPGPSFNKCGNLVLLKLKPCGTFRLKCMEPMKGASGAEARW